MEQKAHSLVVEDQKYYEYYIGKLILCTRACCYCVEYLLYHLEVCSLIILV